MVEVDADGFGRGGVRDSWLVFVGLLIEDGSDATVSTLTPLLPSMLVVLDGFALLFPWLCNAQCSFDMNVNGRWLPLIFCCRDGSGVFLPNLDSKESRLR